jgi:ATP-binding cassette subfamily B protein
LLGAQPAASASFHALRQSVKQANRLASPNDKRCLKRQEHRSLCSCIMRVLTMKKIRFVLQFMHARLLPNFLLTGLCILSAEICSVFLPLCLKKMIDQLDLDPRFTPIAVLFCLYGALILLERLFNEAQFICYSMLERGIVQNAYYSIFSSLFHKRPQFFTENLHGSITSKIHQSVSGLDQLMFDLTFKIAPTIIRFIFIISSMAIIFDWQLSLIIGSGAIFYVIFMHFFNKKLSVHQFKMRNNAIRVQGVTNDFVSSWKDIKLTGSQDFVTKALQTNARSILDNLNQFYIKRGAYGFIQALPICVIFIVSNYYAISEYIVGISTIGGILLVNNYLLQILRPLESFSLVFRGVSKSYADFLCIEEILIEEDYKPQLLLYDDGYKQIIIQDLCVGTILKNINLIVNAGEKIAIIGPSGSGKSTLLNTISGMVSDYTGEVSIGGVNIKMGSAVIVNQYVAYLASDARLIHETVKNNLTLGLDKNTDDALRFIQMNDKIRSLEQGMETIIGENMPLLSAGESQRLKIARTRLLNRQIEIYDESTSALNHELEESILNHLLADTNKTIIFATHHLRCLDKFDKIYQLENGVLKEKINEREYNYQ